MKRLLLSLFGLLPKRPKGHPPFAFRDLQGVEYFAWPDFQQMPPARASQVDDILLQIDAGIGSSTLQAFAGKIESLAVDAFQAKEAKKRNEALFAIGVVAKELRTRRTEIIPEECYYALAAVCAVRKDEDPYTFDPAIQVEKIEAFRLAGRAGHAFFTQQGAFAHYLSVVRTSEVALPHLLAGWRAQKLREQQLMQL